MADELVATAAGDTAEVGRVDVKGATSDVNQGGQEPRRHGPSHGCAQEEVSPAAGRDGLDAGNALVNVDHRCAVTSSAAIVGQHPLHGASAVDESAVSLVSSSFRQRCCAARPRAPTYRPQIDGQIESFPRTLGKAVAGRASAAGVVGVAQSASTCGAATAVDRVGDRTGPREPVPLAPPCAHRLLRWHRTRSLSGSARTPRCAT